MTRSLFRKLSFCARDLLRYRHQHNPNPSPPILSLSASSRYMPRFYSSRNNLQDEANFTQTQNKDAPFDDEDVSNEELKKHIAKLEEGDTGAIPSIFEEILKKLLSEKPEEADNELKEILQKGAESADDTEEEEFDSDLEGMSETDDEDKV